MGQGRGWGGKYGRGVERRQWSGGEEGALDATHCGGGWGALGRLHEAR